MSHDDLTLHVGGEPVEGRALRRAAEHAARRLQECGAGPGRGVLAPPGSGAAFAAADAACRLVGAPLVLRAPYAPQEQLPLAAEVVEAPHPGICDVSPLQTETDRRIPDGVVLLCPTSGSTGASRYAMLTAAGLDYQYRATAARLGIARSDRLGLPLSLHHAYGYSVLGIARLTGAELWLEPGSGVGASLARIRRGQITTLDAVPGFYAALFSRAGDADSRRALAALRFRGCGGETLPAALEQAFLDADAPLCNGYGLTEAGPNVAIGPTTGEAFGTVGPPLEGTEARIDDATGELLVRSPSVTLGYFGRSDARVDADGWLATGDRAEWHGDDLKILGRLVELIKINGSTVAPADIEALLDETHPGNRFAVAAVSDARGRTRLGAVVAATDAAAPDLIRRNARRLLPAELRPHIIVVVGELPTTPVGKLDRGRIRRLLADGAANRQPQPSGSTQW